MQIAVDELKVLPQECLYVGDDQLDILCAKEAGLDVAWITTKNNTIIDELNYNEDYRISSVVEILDLIQNIEKAPVF